MAPTGSHVPGHSGATGTIDDSKAKDPRDRSDQDRKCLRCGSCYQFSGARGGDKSLCDRFVGSRVYTFMYELLELAAWIEAHGVTRLVNLRYAKVVPDWKIDDSDRLW